MTTFNDVVAEARQLEIEFKSGRLSASEYKELLEDLKHSKVIQAAAGDLRLKSQLNEIIEGMISAAGAVF